jgi:hypothetical protein
MQRNIRGSHNQRNLNKINYPVPPWTLPEPCESFFLFEEHQRNHECVPARDYLAGSKVSLAPNYS